MRRFYLISLGCPKNLVDSTGLATLLEQAGYTAAYGPAGADLIVVNTCGFIEPAREESRTALRELVQAKKPGQRIVAAGCYSQRCPDELTEAVPGIDGLIGTRRWMDILTLVEQLDERRARGIAQEPICHLPETPVAGQEVTGVPRVAVQGASAYLKLADGCRRSCAFCAIPLIKGPAVSRPPEAILADAAWLAGRGVLEIILIAQDTTDYGRDLGMRAGPALSAAEGPALSAALSLSKGKAEGPALSTAEGPALSTAEGPALSAALSLSKGKAEGPALSTAEGLTELLERLVTAVPQVAWIRLMYAYPDRVTERLIETMARHPQILPYLDVPLQHAHPDVLRRMRRPADVERVRRTVEQLRAAMQEIAIRTTFLVGYPDETEAEFQTLLDFVAEMRFDRVGVFTYSHEAGTPAARLADNVPPAVKEERRERLMAVQQPISLAKNQALVGRTLDILVEGQGEGLSVGRSYRDAPEIDGLVLVQAELPVGKIVPVRITGALEYDLVGEPV
jgi:ribosomal protein S12 methylthiotransferase